MAWEIEETFDSDPLWGARKIGTTLDFNLSKTAMGGASIGALPNQRYGGLLSSTYSKSDELTMRFLIKKADLVLPTSGGCLLGVSVSGDSDTYPFIGAMIYHTGGIIRLYARCYNSAGTLEYAWADTNMLYANLPPSFIIEAKIENATDIVRIKFLDLNGNEFGGETYNPIPVNSTQQSSKTAEVRLNLANNYGSTLDCPCIGGGFNLPTVWVDTLWANDNYSPVVNSGVNVTDTNITDCIIGG